MNGLLRLLRRVRPRRQAPPLAAALPADGRAGEAAPSRFAPYARFAWRVRSAPRARLPRACRLCAAGMAAAFVLLLAQVPFLCEYLFARGITRWLSAAVSLLTGAVSASLYEVCAVLLIAGAFALLSGVAVLLARRRFARLRLWLYRLAAAGLAVLLAFALLYAPLYGRASAAEALGLPAADATEESVYEAALFFAGELAEASAALPRGEDGNVLPVHTFAETASLVGAAFDAVGGSYFSAAHVRPKEVLLSVPMSYLGITGIYFPFTAEANVNVNIPCYQIPQVMAHETAHAKGVAREDEANLVSYVLCIRAEDAYLRYSGLMPAVAVLMNALPAALYGQVRARLPAEVLREYANASAHYARYEGAVDAVSSFFNDLFLKANGVSSGTRSYGQTVRGLVALYRSMA